jgi:hypothetical protein
MNGETSQTLPLSSNKITEHSLVKVGIKLKLNHKRRQQTYCQLEASCLRTTADLCY